MTKIEYTEQELAKFNEWAQEQHSFTRSSAGELARDAFIAALRTASQGDRDAYEGAREDLLDWKRRAQRAEAELRRLGYTGIDASDAPATPASASEAVPVAHVVEAPYSGKAVCWHKDVPLGAKLYTHPAPASGEGQQGDFTLTDSWAHRSKATQQQDGQAVALPPKFTEMLVGIINDVQDALGFADEEKECANGSLEIVAAIRELKEDAEIGVKWREDSSLDTWFPFTAQELARLKSLPSTPQPPEGYVLVPREPTEAMVHAAGRVVFAEAGAGVPMYDPFGFAEQTVTETQGKCYRAMIAAAPASHGREEPTNER